MTIVKKLPSKIRIGGQEVKVENVDKFENDHLGQCSLAEGWIRIAEMFNGRFQSESCKRNTYYHEITHIILDTMGENELSGNEKFVNCFGSFLTEVMEKAVFIEEIDNENNQNTNKV